VPGTTVDEHDWMKCGELKELYPYWLGNKMDTFCCPTNMIVLHKISLFLVSVRQQGSPRAWD